MNCIVGLMIGIEIDNTDICKVIFLLNVIQFM